MSLQLVLGNSGAGKSHVIYEKIIQESMNRPERDYMVLVPEQFTMQTQKELVSMHPRKGIMNIDVLSFQRLAYRVFEETGGDQRTLLEETGKSLVLQKIIQEQKQNLGYLKEQMNKPGYLQEMKSLMSELMQYDIDEEQLEGMCKRAENQPVLFYKLKDVQVLYHAYREYLRERYITGEDVLDVLCQVAEQSARLKNCVLVLDGFTGFTPIQNRLLGVLLPLVSKMYVTVTLDEGENPYGKTVPYHLFAMSKKMIWQLCEMASAHKVLIEKEIWVKPHGKSRFSQAKELDFLERHLFRYGHFVYEGKTKQIHMMALENPKEEMQEIAIRIQKMVREDGYRYRDIAVITGDMAVYGDYARQACKGENIPVFIDEKHTVRMNPFVEYLRALFEMIARQFSYESVFRYLRCQMSDLSLKEVDELENYVVALGIRGYGKWQEKWVRSYRGQDPEQLPVLNEYRSRFLEEVGEFTECCRKRGHTVRDLTQALYQFCVRREIQKQLKYREEEFRREGNLSMEKEYGQIYGIVMNLFDKLVEILGEEKISIKDYQQLLESGLDETKVGLIPPSADQVLVGDMERTRLKDVKILFFAGVNDGIIPKKVSTGGLLSEADREFFQKEEIELAPTPREAMFIQKFYLYLNMTKPCEHLYLSYAKADARGEAMSPAYLIGTLHKLFPGLEMEENISGREKVSLEKLVEGLRKITLGEESDGWKELYGWYYRNPDYRELVERLVETAFSGKPQDVISESVARTLYGEISGHSATRMEKYAACAFAHFLQYGLRIRERQEYEFTSMDMGTVMHNALEMFAKKLNSQKVSWEELSNEQSELLIEESLKEVTADYGNTILHSSARNEYMIARVQRILKRTVWILQEQLKRGKFQPEAFEVSFGGGRIDRLDVCETADKVYVKVMDYKTGSTRFDLVALYHGLQLQLVVYLDAAMKIEKKKHPEKDVEPAGIFYYNIKDPMISGSIHQDLEQVEQKIIKETAMSGLVQDERTVVERLDATLMTLPLAFKTDGSFRKGSSVATKRQFSELMDFVNDKIDTIKQEILQGTAQMNPYERKLVNACTWCTYRQVCGFDEKLPGCEYRRIPEFDNDALWEKIVGEERRGTDEGSMDQGTTESH